MATITLMRTNEYVNRFREYGVYVDNEKIGTIGNGQTKSFETDPGTHTIYAKIDWCYSPEYTFDINQSDNIIFNIGAFTGPPWVVKYIKWLAPICAILIVLNILLRPVIHYNLYYLAAPFVLPGFLILVYFLSIGRKKYLSLSEEPSRSSQLR